MKLSAPQSCFYVKPLATSAGGFTMIELLLAVAIMAIVAAFTLPGLAGIYDRQQLANAANEVLMTVKQTQNLAISNSQGNYAKLPGDPTADCSSTKPYVSYYVFRVLDTSNYAIRRVFKTPDASGNPCLTPSSAVDTIAQKVTLPAGITFASADPTKAIYYKTTSGAATVLGGSGGNVYFTLNSARLPASVVTYYLCVGGSGGGSARVQTTQCW